MTTTSLTILKLDSSGRKSGSVSRQLSARLVNRFARESEVNVIERDVAGGLPAVTEEWIGSNFTPSDERSEVQTALLAQSDELVAELRAADVLVIGMPIYNFGVPASLKAWIDLICRAGETFQYGENGPEGLLTGKRAIVTVASGGVPVGSPMDHATTYLTQVLGFVGITDVTYVSATGLAMDSDAAIKSAESEIDALNISQLLAA
ncbi:MAG: NAD(P)H-dependent oxidoreductase [Rhodobacteraceae bacterium]|nr:NAD(P)H-dependent oxidoreductase [Paracoccaceae bacterium]MBL4874205.1 NAD(P)H-dependent oxidoreductase [Paracoccaceae bacterium]